jgi:hypothetical protein
MSYSLTADARPGYLHVKVIGENTRENVLGYLLEVNERCVQQKSPAVLIEENLRGPSLNIAEVFAIVAERSHTVSPQLRWIAYVDVNPEHSKGRMLFAETVAVRRGVNVRVFSTIVDAEQWLRDQLKSQPPERS